MQDASFQNKKPTLNYKVRFKKIKFIRFSEHAKIEQNKQTKIDKAKKTVKYKQML